MNRSPLAGFQPLGDTTLVRYLTALKDPAYKLIEEKLLVETLPMDFMEVLRAGNTSTNVYLRRFQNHAVDMDSRAPGPANVAIAPDYKLWQYTF